MKAILISTLKFLGKFWIRISIAVFIIIGTIWAVNHDWTKKSTANKETPPAPAATPAPTPAPIAKATPAPASEKWKLPEAVVTKVVRTRDRNGGTTTETFYHQDGGKTYVTVKNARFPKDKMERAKAVKAFADGWEKRVNAELKSVAVAGGDVEAKIAELQTAIATQARERFSSHEPNTPPAEGILKETLY